MRKALVLIAATFAGTSQAMAQENRYYPPKPPGSNSGSLPYAGQRSPYPAGAWRHQPPMTLYGPNYQRRGTISQDPIFRDSYTIYDKDGKRIGTVRTRKY